jgi:hypothetical protein
MDGLLPVLVMENILVLASCPSYHGRPLLPHPLPLPSDDGTIQQSTNNQPYSIRTDKIATVGII